MLISERLNLKKAEKISRNQNKNLIQVVKEGNFHRIPKESQTEDLVKLAFTNIVGYNSTKKWDALDPKFKTPELIKHIIQKGYDGLGFLQSCKVEITQDLVDFYIQSKPLDFYLSSIPFKFQTKDMVLKIFNRPRPPETKLYYVNPDIVDQDIINKFISIDPRNAEFIPEKFLTKEYKKLIFQYVPRMTRCLNEKEIIEFRDDGETTIDDLRSLPRDFQTKEFLQKLIKHRELNSWEIHAIDQTVFPIELWPKNWLTKIRNAELSRRYIQVHGAHIINELENVEVLVENNEYCLIRYKIPNNNNLRGVNKALIYHCPSSDNMYFTVVDHKIRTLREAIRFLNNGINKEELAYES